MEDKSLFIELEEFVSKVNSMVLANNPPANDLSTCREGLRLLLKSCEYHTTTLEYFTYSREECKLYLDSVQVDLFKTSPEDILKKFDKLSASKGREFVWPRLSNSDINEQAMVIGSLLGGLGHLVSEFVM